jgi:hypothetical protein
MTPPSSNPPKSKRKRGQGHLVCPRCAQTGITSLNRHLPQCHANSTGFDSQEQLIQPISHSTLKYHSHAGGGDRTEDRQHGSSSRTRTSSSLFGEKCGNQDEDDDDDDGEPLPPLDDGGDSSDDDDDGEPLPALDDYCDSSDDDDSCNDDKFASDEQGPSLEVHGYKDGWLYLRDDDGSIKTSMSSGVESEDAPLDKLSSKTRIPDDVYLMASTEDLDVSDNEMNDSSDGDSTGQCGSVSVAHQQEGVSVVLPPPILLPNKNDSVQIDKQYQSIHDRKQMKGSTKFTWNEPVDAPPNVTQLLQGEPLLGYAMEVPPWDGCRAVPDMEPGIISMIRLIDYCDHKQGNSRQFLDGLLRIIVEETDNRGFNPRLALTREAVSKWVIKKYGPGGEPVIAKITITAEDNPVLVEDTRPIASSDNLSVSATQHVDSDQRNDQYLTAVPKPIDNRERWTINCIAFNVKKNLLDILDDRDVFCHLPNLVVNRDNPFLPYQNYSGLADEILDGTWYKDTIARLRLYEKDPFVDGIDFPLPIILYCDKTGTSINQRYPLEPFLFTLCIIRRQVRNSPRCWRPAGFIPDLDTKSSAEKQYIRGKNRGATAQTYHLALEYILKGFQEIQDNGIITWLHLGDHMKRVRLRPEIAFVIGDGKSADMLTSRVPSYHYANHRISRSCHTKQGECDKVTLECQPIEANGTLRSLFDLMGKSHKQVQDERPGQNLTDDQARDIIKEAKDDLHRLSFHPVNNAFLSRGIRFGLDPRNIWGANPIDLMHAFQSGVLMYLVKMTLENLTPTKKTKLDRHVDYLFSNLRSCKRKEYPRLNFSKGFSKLTQLTSDEWAGKLFVILVVLRTDKGRSILEKSFAKMDLEKPSEFKDLKDGTCLPADEEARLYQELAVRVEDASRGGVDGSAVQEVDDMVNPDINPDLDLDDDDDDVPAILPTNRRKRGARNNQVRKRKKKTASDDNDEPEEILRKCSMFDYLELGEALLCFHAWYKTGTHRLDDTTGKVKTEMIHHSVARMLAMVRFYTPRKKGTGWKLQKFHDILHLAMDMERFGSPRNFDAGPHESGLRYWAKLPARTAQMRGYNCFSAQAASRIFEFQCFAKARRENGIVGVRDIPLMKIIDEYEDKLGTTSVSGEQSHSSMQQPKLMGSCFRVYADKVQDGVLGGFVPSKFLGNEKIRKSSLSVHPLIEDYLRSAQNNVPIAKSRNPKNGQLENYWQCFTECTFFPPDKDGPLTLRCHPNYRNEGEWFDWAIIRFERTESSVEQDDEDDDEEYQPQWPSDCVPSKILAFVENPKNMGQPMVLVHGCSFETHSDLDSVLFEFRQLQYKDIQATLQIPRRFIDTTDDSATLDYFGEDTTQTMTVPDLYLVTLDSIVDACFVVEETPGIIESLEKPQVTKRRKQKTEFPWVMLIKDRTKWAELFTEE